MRAVVVPEKFVTADGDGPWRSSPIWRLLARSGKGANLVFGGSNWGVPPPPAASKKGRSTAALLTCLFGMLVGP